MLSGLLLVRVVGLRWQDLVVPPCAVLEAALPRLVAMAVLPCAVLLAMSQ